MPFDSNDPNSVLWLQNALTRMPGYAGGPPSGKHDKETHKAIIRYQKRRGLPATGDADADTVQKIEQDLAKI